MNLEDYFETLKEGDIQIKGTRIGIEIVLDDYLHGESPEEVTLRYRSLTLEQVYATITYYLHKQELLDEYLEQWRKDTESAWHKQGAMPSPAIRKLLDYKAQRTTMQATA